MTTGTALEFTAIFFNLAKNFIENPLFYIFMILLILSVERVSRKLTDICDAIKSGNKLFKDR